MLLSLKNRSFRYAELLSLAPLLAILILYSGLVWRFAFVCDDAFITYRYSKHLVGGYGLRYNISDEVIEGYSNFLWMLVAAIPEYFDVSTPIFCSIISFLCGFFLLGAVYYALINNFKVSKGIALLSVLLLALSAPYFVWSTGGLETMAFTLVLFLAFYLLSYSTSRKSAIAASILLVILALLRFEGVVWSFLIAVSALLYRHYVIKDELYPSLAKILGYGFLAYLIYFTWRASYFVRWLPNTVAAKVGANDHWQGIKYIASLSLEYPVIGIWLAIAVWVLIHYRNYHMVTVASGVAWAFAIFSIAVGGDFMALGRFMVPALPFLTVVFARWLEENRYFRKNLVQLVGVVFIGLSLLPLSSFQANWGGISQFMHFRHNSSQVRSELEQWQFMKENSEKWRKKAEALNRHTKPGEHLVISAIGNVGYYTDLHILDRVGLVNYPVAARIALGAKRRKRSPGHDSSVEPDFFLETQPEYLSARLIPSGHKIAIARIVEKWVSKYATRGYLPHRIEDQDGVLLLLKRAEL